MDTRKNTMSKLIVTACFMFGTICLNAQDEKNMIESKQDSVYCLVMKDGLAVLTSSSGRVITNEISMSNGAKLTPKGVLTKKDGKQIIMKDGDCTNTLGEPMQGNATREKIKRN
ncbi:hypothetical protein CNR22_14035 [Sphingobacteriaceae bacterium]|nr:hypothetical protein CNR22_14035 [Sphingobacteriaceae bacterium]